MAVSSKMTALMTKERYPASWHALILESLRLTEAIACFILA